MGNITTAEKIKELSNWSMCDCDWDGHFRYVIASKVAYEIITMYRSDSKAIETANASLYLVGKWKGKDDTCFHLERELLGNGTIRDLLKIASDDYKNNFK